jgi:hypothetical protein
MPFRSLLLLCTEYEYVVGVGHFVARHSLLPTVEYTSLLVLYSVFGRTPRGYRNIGMSILYALSRFGEVQKDDGEVEKRYDNQSRIQRRGRTLKRVPVSTRVGSTSLETYR